MPGWYRNWVLLVRQEGQHFCTHHTFCFMQIPVYLALPGGGQSVTACLLKRNLQLQWHVPKSRRGPYLSGPAKHEPRRGQRSTCGTSGMTIISWIEKAGRIPPQEIKRASWSREGLQQLQAFQIGLRSCWRQEGHFPNHSNPPREMSDESGW